MEGPIFREAYLQKEISVSKSIGHRHLPIVLVKVAYYASGSARFLPKLCSNYATFLKNYWIRGVYPGQVVQALVYPLCSRNLVNYLDVSSLHLTGLAWRPPF